MKVNLADGIFVGWLLIGLAILAFLIITNFW